MLPLPAIPIMSATVVPAVLMLFGLAASKQKDKLIVESK